MLLEGFETFRGAAEAVRSGGADRALLPIENTTAGSINETYDLLAEGGLTITAEAVSHIDDCLLVLPGTRLEDLRTVISHPQGLLQCQEFLHGVPWIEARAEFDTAGSARKVRERNDPTVGAIAGESAARVFGLRSCAAASRRRRGTSPASSSCLFTPSPARPGRRPAPRCCSSSPTARAPWPKCSPFSASGGEPRQAGVAAHTQQPVEVPLLPGSRRKSRIAIPCAAPWRRSVPTPRNCGCWASYPEAARGDEAPPRGKDSRVLQNWQRLVVRAAAHPPHWALPTRV